MPPSERVCVFFLARLYKRCFLRHWRLRFPVNQGTSGRVLDQVVGMCSSKDFTWSQRSVYSCSTLWSVLIVVLENCTVFCFIVSQSALDHLKIFLGFFFDSPGLSTVSTTMKAWSENPGIVVMDSIRLGLFVQKRSKTLFF